MRHEAAGMKVGILAPVLPESLGGGHTFEHEIFEQLIESAKNSKHEFVVFETSNTGVGSGNLKRVPLKPPAVRKAQSKLSKVGRTLRFAPRKIVHLFESKWAEEIFAREGIEFFLNVSSGTATLEVPFLTIVWDLQHRVNPFFPEVSTDGTWQSRETYFSLILKRATYVIVGTQAGKQEVQTFYGVPDERIRILPHPTPRFALEQNPADDVHLSKYKLPQDYVFYPAQFWSHKNHVGLLHAIDRLKRSENLRLPVVFTGSDQGNERHVRQLVRTLQLEDQVHFLGHVSRETLKALYQNAFALCYASFSGPENLPPLEAFASGCPVVAADIPGASEQLGDAALLVNPAKELDIAQALKSLFQDKAKRENLITRGKERARRFTGSDFAKGLLDLLDEFQPIRRCWPPPA
jgi:glycosyltransferase involved in cell wall biosynthesis